MDTFNRRQIPDPTDSLLPVGCCSPSPDKTAATVNELVLPEQSGEDTDAGWGEYTEPYDDEWLRRDRPPHWDDY